MQRAGQRTRHEPRRCRGKARADFWRIPEKSWPLRAARIVWNYVDSWARSQALPLAARSLGASPARAFIHVVLPLSLPGLLAGCVLVFMLAVGFYITPALLGGDRDITIASLIEMVVRDLLDWPFGAMLSLSLIAMVGAIFAFGALIVGADRITGTEGRA